MCVILLLGKRAELEQMLLPARGSVRMLEGTMATRLEAQGEGKEEERERSCSFLTVRERPENVRA